MSEYKKSCDVCKSSGLEPDSRIYFEKINNEWLFICSNCLNKKVQE